ncbi:MAG: aminodeoxychorismate synthase component I [Cyclobacteriaceae bacterium]|nr:aminodeoxychorismate synthase component I [Cyclobacteriaceae bacterium]
MYNRQEAIELMNTWGQQRLPFLFIIDFNASNVLLYPMDSIPEFIHYSINGVTNSYQEANHSPFSFEAKPVAFEIYERAFQEVVSELNYGNSYLLNLTFPTLLGTTLTLKEVFLRSTARYKLWVDPQFVVFSPESFVRIEEGMISSYPMKGTIDASIPNAREALLTNPKEQAEHATIVDLIRNDLSKVATGVKVTDYRYVEEVQTFKKKLLQVSSKIEGVLPKGYHSQLGDLMFQLLPAGSVTGAPKKKTVEIIHKAEPYERGYFTGIFGIFDGYRLDSGVMIRFIENTKGTLTFKSGGGITAQSDPNAEYRELIDKVYVPFV